MSIVVVLAATEDGIIGVQKPDGTTRMPWDMIPVDNAWFRGLIADKNIVVGRKTFEELENFLPRWTTRDVFVFSQSWPSYEGSHSYVSNLAQRFQFPEEDGGYAIIGGAQTAAAAIPYAWDASLTVVPQTALLPLQDGEEYIRDEALVASIHRNFSLKRIMPYTGDTCRILYGKSKD